MSIIIFGNTHIETLNHQNPPFDMAESPPPRRLSQHGQRVGVTKVHRKTVDCRGGDGDGMCVTPLTGSNGSSDEHKRITCTGGPVPISGKDGRQNKID